MIINVLSMPLINSAHNIHINILHSCTAVYDFFHEKNLKNRILKNEELPIRIDSLVAKMSEHYAGDHLLLQALTNVNKSRVAPLPVVIMYKIL